jgi:predicted alpha-1,6-mannanase (GH76 family)
MGKACLRLRWGWAGGGLAAMAAVVVGVLIGDASGLHAQMADVQMAGGQIPAGLAAGARGLDFTAREVNPVVFWLQADHYCSPYPGGVVQAGEARYIGDVGRGRPVAVKAVPVLLADSGPVGAATGSVGDGSAAGLQGITGMWAEKRSQCDLGRQQVDFYDSVWRDSIRFEALVNYRRVFGPTLRGVVSMEPYAVDDGVVSAAMTTMLTEDSMKTLGAQNDDIMWWALAFLRAYEANRTHTAYLTAAKEVFARVHASPEQAVCGGGVMWGDGTNYKNAITNALYLLLAARLGALSAGGSPERQLYVTTAVAQAKWLMDRSNLLADGGVLLDGVHYKGDTCNAKPDGLDVWTYSQGVAIDGLAELTALTGDRSYADEAQHMLLRVLDPKQTPALVNAQGVLMESADAGRNPSEDAETFKGLLVRHVGYALGAFAAADAKRYAPAIDAGRSLLMTSANTLWANRVIHGDRVDLPFDWAQASGSASAADPRDPVDMRSTASGLNLLNAAWGAAAGSSR